MLRANQLKANSSKERDKHDQESKQLRQTLKVAMSDGTDPMSGEMGPASVMMPNRQPLKKGYCHSVFVPQCVHV